MQTGNGTQGPVWKRAVFAALVLGLSLSACASPRLSGLGLGTEMKADAAKEHAKPPAAAMAAPDFLADVESAIRQAQTLRKSGDLPGAARVLSQVLLFVPDNPRLLGEYGKVLAAEGRSDDALAFLERAIQLQPAEWSLYSAQGVAYDNQGRYPAARESYNRALALKPGEPAVLNNAALSHMQSGDLDGAERLLLQAGSVTELPRIAQNLALVRSLRASRADDAPAIAVAPAMREPDPVAAAAPAVTPPRPLAAALPVQTAALPVAHVAPPEPKPAAVQSAAVKPVLAKIAPTRAAQTSARSAYYVQAGAYGTEERAGRIAHDLDSLGARVSPTTVGGHAIYRVRIGPFHDAGQAGTAVDQAREMGHADLKIVLE